MKAKKEKSFKYRFLAWDVGNGQWVWQIHLSNDPYENSAYIVMSMSKTLKSKRDCKNDAMKFLDLMRSIPSTCTE